MRTLTVGLLVFIGWSVFATYIYVCKIHNFCSEPATNQITLGASSSAVIIDTAPKQLVPVPETVPKNITVNFAFDNYEFKADSTMLKSLKEWNTYLLNNPKFALKITGHTDAIGTKKYNQSLGQKRALAVQYYFVQQGISVNKIILESKGELEPIDVNYTSIGRMNNRRTVITLNK